MSPRNFDPPSDDDSDAPEAISLKTSRKLVQKENTAIQAAQTAEKQKKREKNRQKDQRLKEQAKTKKEKEQDSSADEDEDNDVLARMRRAMQDAEGEDSNEEDEVEDAEMKDADSDEDESEGEAPKINPNYLPDDVFTAAFASESRPSASSTKSKAKSVQEKQRRKKKSRRNPKDVVIGSRTMRSLVESKTPATGGVAQTAKVKKFLDRTLALKTGKSSSRGWERRPASVGSLRTSGPAARFVRS
ncbi:hypothetical protein CYLTODRAFT_382580 [Cylindrobasidium torrendii FP15055 ss-10]|uniref:Uncharacterized protein n=1 Tax=Cylindrobasidium torrendii FP15055 ss-10 TaxID=1314674 RepID=A0A0D7AZ40_9AGAR|nr:hypothetical protein CYLTODRAFT_382580 [Cylindrobasidium torrendii FP15055 ss-10]